MITSPFSTRKYRSPSSPIDPLFPGQAIKKTCRDHLPPWFSDPSSHNRKRHLLQLAQHTIPNGIGKKMKKIQGPNERKRVISCRGEDLSGSSPLGIKTSILQQPYHEKNRPASPKHPFLFENGKNPLPDFEKKTQPQGFIAA